MIFIMIFEKKSEEIAYFHTVQAEVLLQESAGVVTRELFF